jgi:hypothetical protein
VSVRKQFDALAGGLSVPNSSKLLSSSSAGMPSGALDIDRSKPRFVMILVL